MSNATAAARTTRTGRDLPRRTHAGMFDRQLPLADNRQSDHGNRLEWNELWQDTSTGEQYVVACWDGEATSKLAHNWNDHAELEDMHVLIISRCHSQAAHGVKEIRITPEEWVIMSNFTHVKWLESRPGALDGQQSRRGYLGGLVGHCHGVPVVCVWPKRGR